MAPLLFSDEPGWESGREVQGRIAARLGRVAEEERKQEVRRVLKEMGVIPFVMQYKRTPWTRKVAFWGNCPAAFWSCDVDEYDRAKKRSKSCA